MTDCRQLLADYAQTRSEPAFREIVTRYLNLVYSSALRLVDGDEHRARDVAQVVFADLARKAGEISPEIMLGGWLHRHTCFVAANTLRGERRRLAREREAVEMNILHEDAGADFARLAPLLDETINQLDEADRTAILLRFFEQKDFQNIGQSLASSEDAARMRVNRALDKLRDLLAQRGIRTTAGALGIAITANAVQAAPVGLAVTISAVALAGTAATTSTLIAATKTIAMTTLQKTFIAAALTAAIGTGIYQTIQASSLQKQFQSLQQMQADWGAQIQQLQRERNEATNQLAGLLAENAQLKSNSNENELLKLRGEITQLKNTENKSAEAETKADPVEIAAKNWLTKVNLLKQRLDQMPNAKIPELQFATEMDWLNAALGTSELKTDDDYLWDLHNLFSQVEDKFGKMGNKALEKYIQANNGQFPADLSQLQPYFDSPVDDAVLQRYEIVPASSIPNEKEIVGNFDWLVAQKVRAFENYKNEGREVFGVNGYGNSWTFW